MQAAAAARARRRAVVGWKQPKLRLVGEHYEASTDEHYNQPMNGSSQKLTLVAD